MSAMRTSTTTAAHATSPRGPERDMAHARARRALAWTAAGVASAAALFGGTLLAAPAASAVSVPSACTTEWAWPQKKVATTAVNLRTGPSTAYTSLGILSKGVHFTEYCTRNAEWSWGTVTTGPNARRSGWVKTSYLNWV